MKDDLTAEVTKYVTDKKETIDGGFKNLTVTTTQKTVCPTELASAFALASLASLSSPGSGNVIMGTPPRESRESKSMGAKNKGDDEVRKAASFDVETRSPKASEHPLSPEQRSQSTRDHNDDAAAAAAAAADDDDVEDEEEGDDQAAAMAQSSASAEAQQRKVSFAPNTKANDTPSTPPTITKLSRGMSGGTASASASEHCVLPMPSPTMQMSPGMQHMSPTTMVSPRPHRMYGGRGQPAFVRTPSPRSSDYPPPYGSMNMMMAPPPPPHASYHHYQHSFRHGPPPSPFQNGGEYGGGFPPHHPHHQQHLYRDYPPGGPPPRSASYMGPSPPPPHHLMQPALLHQHKHKSSSPSPSMTSSPQGAGVSASRSSSSSTDETDTTTTSSSNQWICDYCNVASFSSYEEACAHEEICQKSSADPTKSGPPSAALLSMGSRSYSAGASMDQDDLSVASYHSAMMMPSSPHHNMSPMTMSSPSPSSPMSMSMSMPLPMSMMGHHGPGYHPHGGFAGHGPMAMAAARRHRHQQQQQQQQQQAQMMSSMNMNMNHMNMMDYHHQQQQQRMMDESSNSSNNYSPPLTAPSRASSSKSSSSSSKKQQKLQQQQQQQQVQPFTAQEHHQQEVHLQSLGGYLVSPSDQDLIPPYVYTLMRQVEPCLFTEADRFVARSKGPVGYPGFHCRHCQGHAGLGRYFPVASKSLSTNSTSQNIHAHLLKCRKCPPEIKEQLVQLKLEKSRAARLEPGWRKVFFDQVWQRLHYHRENSHHHNSNNNSSNNCGNNNTITNTHNTNNNNDEDDPDDNAANKNKATPTGHEQGPSK